MNLETMRVSVYENTKLAYSTEHLNRLINRASEHIVNLVEQTSKMYNVCGTPISVAVVSGTKAYKISAVSPTLIAIRKILLVERTDLDPNNPTDCVLIDMRHKNRFNWGYPYLNEVGARSVRPVVYFTRQPNPSSTYADWYLNFAYDPKASMTLQVYYAPQLSVLFEDGDAPTEVPENHHELIVIRATIMCLSQAGKDVTPWMQQYVELRQMMESDLHRWNKTGPWVRQFFATHA